MIDEEVRSLLLGLAVGWIVGSLVNLWIAYRRSK